MAKTQAVLKRIKLTRSNIQKIEKISRKKGVSFDGAVRLAVDQYQLDTFESVDQELISFTSEKLKNAIAETNRVSRKIKKTVQTYGASNL